MLTGLCCVSAALTAFREYTYTQSPKVADDGAAAAVALAVVAAGSGPDWSLAQRVSVKEL